MYAFATVGVAIAPESIAIFTNSNTNNNDISIGRAIVINLNIVSICAQNIELLT